MKNVARLAATGVIALTLIIALSMNVVAGLVPFLLLGKIKKKKKKGKKGKKGGMSFKDQMAMQKKVEAPAAKPSAPVSAPGPVEKEEAPPTDWKPPAPPTPPAAPRETMPEEPLGSTTGPGMDDDDLDDLDEPVRLDAAALEMYEEEAPPEQAPPEPTEPSGMPLTMGPEPMEPESMPLTPEPEPMEPEGMPFKPEPGPMEPEGMPFKPETEPVGPEGMPFKPEPEPMEPEGMPFTPEPETMEPEGIPLSPEPEPMGEFAPSMEEPEDITEDDLFDRDEKEEPEPDEDIREVPDLPPKISDDAIKLSEEIAERMETIDAELEETMGAADSLDDYSDDFRIDEDIEKRLAEREEWWSDWNTELEELLA